MAAHEVADTAGFEGAGRLEVLEFKENAAVVISVEAGTIAPSTNFNAGFFK